MKNLRSRINRLEKARGSSSELPDGEFVYKLSDETYQTTDGRIVTHEELGGLVRPGGMVLIWDLPKPE